MVIDDDVKKILEIVIKIDEKLDSLASRVSKLESGDKRSGSIESSSESITRKPSDIVDEQKLGRVSEPVEGRIKCPKCGSLNINQREDRSKAISYSGGIAIYAKKNLCKQCSHEWQ